MTSELLSNILVITREQNCYLERTQYKMKDYINQQKKGYLNRLKHIQEKIFDYQMQLEELEDDLDNEGRDAKDDDYDDWCADLSAEVADAASNLSDISCDLEELINDKEKEGKKDDWQFFMGTEHVFDNLTIDTEELLFTEYLSRILQIMHALKKEKRMDFMIIPRNLVDDNLRPNYDKMLNNARRELKQ